MEEGLAGFGLASVGMLFPHGPESSGRAVADEQEKRGRCRTEVCCRSRSSGCCGCRNVGRNGRCFGAGNRCCYARRHEGRCGSRSGGCCETRTGCCSGRRCSTGNRRCCGSMSGGWCEACTLGRYRCLCGSCCGCCCSGCCITGNKGCSRGKHSPNHPEDGCREKRWSDKR